MSDIINYIIELFFWTSLGLLIGLNLEHIIQNDNLYYKILIGYIVINFFIIVISGSFYAPYKIDDTLEIFIIH